MVVLFGVADFLEANCTGKARDAIAAVLALKPEVAVLVSTGTPYFITIHLSLVVISAELAAPAHCPHTTLHRNAPLLLMAEIQPT